MLCEPSLHLGERLEGLAQVGPIDGVHVAIFNASQACMACWRRDAGINGNLFGSEGGAIRIRRDALAAAS
jgi:hypothetical protein